MTSPLCLLICRSPKAIKFLSKIQTKTSIVLATDDPRVQDYARSHLGVKVIRFLEKTESFYSVAEDVVRILAWIEKWLTAFSEAKKGVFFETLSWGRNVEGGLLNQRIQDALLLIRSYNDLIADIKPTEIRLISEAEYIWDDIVLEYVAQTFGIPCHRQYCQLPHTIFKIVQAWLRPFAITSYYIFNIFRAGGGTTSRRAPDKVNAATIIFQLSSSLRKHVENISPLMQALSKRGEKTIAICWLASERLTRKDAIVQLREEGLEALRLERWVTLIDIVVSFTQAARFSSRLRRLVKSKEFVNGLGFRGVPLAPLLNESLRHFLWAELPQRIRIQRALEHCLINARPRALKPWAGPESFEGQAILRVLQPPRPFVFHYWLGASLDWPYADRRYSPDLFLASGPQEARHAQKDYALDKDQIVVVGQARYTEHPKFAATYTPAESRRALNIQETSRRYIAFDPNCAIRGYQSAREQAEMLNALVEAARQLRDLTLVIKPHPSYAIAHLQPLLSRANLPNVMILHRFAPIKHLLNGTDLIVTKYSTLILEAALMNRPSVAALFDGEQRFKTYGDLPEIVETPSFLTDLVVRLAADDRFFSAWRSAQLAKQATLLPQFYSTARTSPSQLAAETIIVRTTARAFNSN